MIRLIILLCISTFVNTNPEEISKQIAETCRKEHNDEARLCYYECVYTKAGTITKDGQFTLLKSDPAYNEAKKCFEEFKHLQSCERATMYHNCFFNIILTHKCAVDLGYSQHNWKDVQNNICSVKCKWTYLKVLDMNGELNITKVDVKDKADFIKCYQKFIKEPVCERALKTQTCLMNEMHISQCAKEIGVDLQNHNDKNINCLSACMLRKTGIYNEQNELVLSKIFPSFRKFAKKCYSSTQSDVCAQASAFRMCFFMDSHLSNIYVKQCTDETKIQWPNTGPNAMHNMLQDESKACLLRCILKKLHVLNDENLFDAKYVDIYTMGMNPEQNPEIEKFVQECNQKVLHKDVCIDTMIIANCVYAKLKKLREQHK